MTMTPKELNELLERMQAIGKQRDELVQKHFDFIGSFLNLLPYPQTEAIEQLKRYYLETVDYRSKPVKEGERTHCEQLYYFAGQAFGCMFIQDKTLEERMLRDYTSSIEAKGEKLMEEFRALNKKFDERYDDEVQSKQV